MILGDVKIDFLKYNNDVQTSAYLDMLFDLGFMPVITKATRVTDHTSSLIDHIYTNTPEKVIKSGICQRGRHWFVDKCLLHAHFSSHEP
jgi:hypothetical protein